MTASSHHTRRSLPAASGAGLGSSASVSSVMASTTGSASETEGTHPGQDVAGAHAPCLSAQGFVALPFHARYLGTAGGTPRIRDDTRSRVGGIHSTADAALDRLVPVATGNLR